MCGGGLLSTILNTRKRKCTARSFITLSYLVSSPVISLISKVGLFLSLEMIFLQNLTCKHILRKGFKNITSEIFRSSSC